MADVTIRDLRNHGGAVIDRVAAGERVRITRDGRPVAELRPVRAPRMMARTLLERWRRLPRLDAEALRRDIDATLDSGL
jgi:prevent-host-death family protein